MKKKGRFLQNLSCFSRRATQKKAQIVSDETIKWIIYIAIIIAVGVAIRLILKKAAG